jgi:C-5 cytosine-specific DNA methylase
MPQTLTQCGFVRYNKEADGPTTTGSRRVSLEEEDGDNDNDDEEEDEFQEFTQEFTQRAAFHEEDDDFLKEDEEEDDDDDVLVADETAAAACTNDEVVARNNNNNSPQESNKKKKKKRRICRQSTLDFAKITSTENNVLLPNATGAAATSMVKHFQDTKDRCYVPHGFKMLVFNKNETWIIEVNRGPSYGMEQYMFTIADFCVQQANKYGLSHRPLVGSLARTFIGSEQARRLLSDPAWQRMHPVDPGLVKCYMDKNNNVLLPSPDGAAYAYRLRQLRALDQNAPPFYRSSADLPPEPSLVYEENLENHQHQGKRSQFTMVYRQKNHLSAGNAVETNTRGGVAGLVDHNIKTKHKPVALDLFAGAGGMGLGLAKAGFDVKFAVESNPAAAATLRCNHRDTLVFEEDVQLFLEKSKGADPCYPKPGFLHHIHASSPCQGFSDANRNGGVNDLANNELSFLFVKAVRHYLPRTGSFENVFGMLNEPGGNRRYIQKIMADLLLLGMFSYCITDILPR